MMPEYRAFIIGRDGHFVGYEPLICADDNEAMEKAERFSNRGPIELWSGTRFVTKLSQRGNDAVTDVVEEVKTYPRAP